MSLNSGTAPPPTAPSSLLGVFLRFLRRPVYSERPYPSQNRRAVLNEIFRLYSLKISLLIPILLVISSARAQLGATEDPINELFNDTPLFVLGLAIVIVAPLLEEMIFRLPLRFSALNISLPLAFLLLFIDIGNPGLRFFLTGAAGLCTREFLHHDVKRKTGHAFYAKHISWMVYGSTLLFGAVHILNFDAKTYLIAPLIVMPQTMGGMFYAFIRLRHSFWWSVFAHGSFNFSLFIPICLVQFGLNEQQTNPLFGETTTTTTTTSEYAALTVLTIYLGGVLFLCLSSTWKMFKEWRLEC